MFHTQIWVQNNLLHFIMDNYSHKKFVSEYILKKLGIVTTPHPHPYNISWMKDGRELRITHQCRITYFIKSFEDEVVCDMALLSVTDALFRKPYWWDRHGRYQSLPQKVIVKIQNQWYDILERQPTPTVSIILPNKQRNLSTMLRSLH